MEKRDRPNANREQMDGSLEPKPAPRSAPGKVTRTSKLSPSRGPAVQRKATAPSPDTTPRQARSRWELTMDPWMDAAHRGVTALGDAHASEEPSVTPAGRQGIAEVPPALPDHGGGTEMPEDVRGTMEAAFGADFSAVRIHEGSHAAAVGALAYTQGTDIHFAPGQYQPTSQRGQELLGHELAHVVQQSQGQMRATTQVGGVDINDDASLEREADGMGARAARGEGDQETSQRSIEAPRDGAMTDNAAVSPRPAVAPAGGVAQRFADPQLDEPELGRSHRWQGTHVGLDVPSLHVDPSLQAQAMEALIQRLEPEFILQSLLELEPPSVFGRPPETPFQNDPAAPPLVPPGAGPDTPRPGELKDLLRAIMAVPAVRDSLQALCEETIASVRNATRGERIGIITYAAPIALGALVFPPSRELLLQQLAGKRLKSRRLPMLSVQIDLAGRDKGFMFFLDVGALLPPELGFESSGD
jgi:hypothetical protein